MLELITSYSLAVKEICHEISISKNGDRIAFCLYLWEPGESSDLIMKELNFAAKCGVHITIDVDCSRVSRFARLVEHTKSFMGNIKRLQENYPANVRCLCQSFPNHSKFYLFERGGENSTLIFGGMNLGDRFTEWKDFLVKVQGFNLGKYVYETFVLEKEHHNSNNLPLKIIMNDPKRKIFEIENTLKNVFGDKRFREYTIITPYIDRRGIDLLSEPLRRGATVRLIIPVQANIYQNANMRNISKFAVLSNVKVLTFQKMIHAKAVLANGDAKTCFLGSANLKKNSFDKLGEFNGLIDDVDFNNQLSNEVDRIAKSCIPFVVKPYKKIMSRVEEFLG